MSRKKTTKKAPTKKTSRKKNPAAVEAPIEASVPLQENPPPPPAPPVGVAIGDHGGLVLTGNPIDIGRVLTALQGPMQVVMPNPVAPAEAPALPAPEPPQANPTNAAMAVQQPTYHAVFLNDQGAAVHKTNPKRLWTEARRDMNAWLQKNPTKAKTAIIYNGDDVAPNHGSRIVRKRTAWHIH
jgi:hypothetical protein